MLKKNESGASNVTATVEYENYDPNKYVAMDELGDRANNYVATDEADGNDRDTDSETDAIGENTKTAEIYGNSIGKN